MRRTSHYNNNANSPEKQHPPRLDEFFFKKDHGVNRTALLKSPLLELACFSRPGRVLTPVRRTARRKAGLFGPKAFLAHKKKEPCYNAGLEVLRGIGGLVPRLSESALCRAHSAIS